MPWGDDLDLEGRAPHMEACPNGQLLHILLMDSSDLARRCALSAATAGRIKDVFTKLAMSTQVAKDGGNNNNIQPGGRGRDINGFERRRSGSCFDLFGADIMFRKDLTPILMEVGWPTLPCNV